jgi:hypothetical protein
MNLPGKAIVGLLFFTAGACSSSSTTSTSTSSGAGGATGATGAGGATVSSTDAASSSGAGGAASTSSAASSSTGTMAISAECKEYCDCYAANCAMIQAIPGGMGCPEFCAGFTPDQWTCRNAHCSLVVPEMNPNHCQHAVGIDQCL